MAPGDVSPLPTAEIFWTAYVFAGVWVSGGEAAVGIQTVSDLACWLELITSMNKAVDKP